MLNAEFCLINISRTMNSPLLIHYQSIISPITNLYRPLKKPSLGEKCPYLELFWSAVSRIRTEYGEIRSISPHSIRMRENADQNNSEYERFSTSAFHEKSVDHSFVTRHKTQGKPNLKHRENSI